MILTILSVIQSIFAHPTRFVIDRSTSQFRRAICGFPCASKPQIQNASHRIDIDSMWKTMDNMRWHDCFFFQCILSRLQSRRSDAGDCSQKLYELQHKIEMNQSLMTVQINRYLIIYNQFNSINPQSNQINSINSIISANTQNGKCFISFLVFRPNRFSDHTWWSVSAVAGTHSHTIWTSMIRADAVFSIAQLLRLESSPERIKRPTALNCTRHKCSLNGKLPLFSLFTFFSTSLLFTTLAPNVRVPPEYTQAHVNRLETSRIYTDQTNKNK